LFKITFNFTKKKIFTGYMEMEGISTTASTTKSFLELEFDFHS